MKCAVLLISILMNTHKELLEWSKLYLHSKDLKDLNWPALLKGPKLVSDTADKLDEVIHDRSKNTQPQTMHNPTNQPSPGRSTAGQGQPQGQGRDTGRCTQTHGLPSSLKDCVTVILQL